MTKAEYQVNRIAHYQARGKGFDAATQQAARDAAEMFPYGTPAAVERDFSAEATAVYVEAYERAMCAYQGTDAAEAESYATGAGRDAEDIYWAQMERAFA